MKVVSTPNRRRATFSLVAVPRYRLALATMWSLVPVSAAKVRNWAA